MIKGMEHLFANLSGKVRRETLRDRPHLVAPLTLIVPGVLNGSEGPLFYPPEEVQRNPAVWNNVPIVVEHPTSNGQPVSAREPAVFNKQNVGTLFNASVSDKGSLVAEAWFDIEHTRRVDNRILDALQANRPIEVSTGLSLDKEPVTNKEHKGVSYSFVTSNYRPDHLAILLEQKGACSVEDGCGVLVGNARRLIGFTSSNSEHFHTLSVNREGFGTAHQADNHSHRIERFTVLLAESHNHTFDRAGLTASPTQNKNKESEMTDEQRKKLVDRFIANDCCWEESDRETLNAFSDERLTKMQEADEKSSKLELVANAAIKGFEDPEGNSHAFNAKTQKFESKDNPKGKKKKSKNAEEEEEKVIANKKPTEEEWLDSAPTSIREDLAFARNEKRKQKETVVRQLVANVRDEQQQAKLTDTFMKKPLTDLQDMLAIVPEQRQTANYEGAATPSSSVENVEKDFADFMLPEDYAVDKK